MSSRRTSRWFLLFEIQHDTALVAVDALKIAAKVTNTVLQKKRPEPPRDVSGGRLDLDHIRALVLASIIVQ